MTPPIKVDFTSNLPENLPRESDLRLSIELIPLTTTGRNLRSQLTHEQWDTLRHKVYARANYCCEICLASNVEVHCHEVWSYDDEKHIQKLVGLRCLCRKCHNATHLTHVVFIRASDVTKHFAHINNMSMLEANKVVRDAYKQMAERSRHEWTLDTSWLDSYLQKENEST